MRSHEPKPSEIRGNRDANGINSPVDPPGPLDEPDDDTDLDDFNLPCADEDARWDVFIPDDDERDPLPEPGDFWGSTEHGPWNMEAD